MSKQCNNKTSPPEFTESQKVKCCLCWHSSAKKIWCCLFRCRIVRHKKNEIIRQPVPDAVYAKWLDENRFKQNYKAALTFYKETEKKLVDMDTFVERRQKCAECPPEDKSVCECAGCRQWQKLVLKGVSCPKGKW